mgnify:FL=1
MQFLSGFEGVGRYFETPAAYAAGERFEVAGAEGDYQAPVAGLGARVLGLTHEHPHHHRYAPGYTHFGAHDRAPSQKRVSDVSALRGRVKGGMGRYFETPAAYAAGERFEAAGAEGDYQAPVEGVGRYFETPAAYAAGERFEMVGAEGDYQAPVEGVGRYFENSFGIKNNLGPFQIKGANEVYRAPPYGGVNGLGQIDAQNPLVSIKVDTHPLMWILLGAAGGVFGTMLVRGMRK